MKKVLIQLIGGQVLPNIFSILAVKPDVVVNIYTKQTKGQHADIMAWCSKFGPDFEIAPKFAKTDLLDLDFQHLGHNMDRQIQKVAEEALEDGDTLVILNMTGGTKPMSFCAIASCQNLESNRRFQQKGFKIPSFYVDTDNASFDFFSHADMKDQVLANYPFSKANSLSIGQIVETAQGRKVVSSKTEDVWQSAYKVACLLQEEYNDFTPEDITYKNMVEMVSKPLEELVKEEKRPKKKTPQRLRAKEFVQRALHDPDLVKGLVAAGFEQREDSFYFPATLQEEAALFQQEWEAMRLQSTTDKERKNALHGRGRTLLRKITGIQNFISGGWWEILVAHAYKACHKGHKVLWSVETVNDSATPGKDGGPQLEPVETDIIATDGKSITCISCKRGLHKQVNQELEQHCARTQMLGGIISKRRIAVYRHKDAAIMRKMAGGMNMKVWDQKTIKDMEKGINPYEYKADKNKTHH